MRKKDFRKGKEADLIFSFRKGRARVAIKRWEEDADVLTLRQVHSSKVYLLDDYVKDLEGDAIITQRLGLKVGVRTADCVPLVLLGSRTVAVVHAGWRGLKEGIVEEVLKRLVELERVEDLLAFVGPSAKACCYQVGEEFKDFFEGLHWRGGRLYMDTQQEVLLRLKKAGVRKFVVYGVCTICHQSLPSYRRDRTQERLLTFAELIAEE